MVEMVISSLLLLTVMTFVTTLYFRINLVWKNIGHHRVAVAELSNQLESLTRLSPNEAQVAIESLEPSEYCARTLQAPELSGELLDDVLGKRIVLSLDWNRQTPGKPVELAGWLQPVEWQPDDSNPESESEQAQ